MARKRMISPSLWTSQDVGKLTIFERLLFIGMFSNADDEGKGIANPYLLRSMIFPYDDISIAEIEKAKAHIGQLIQVQFYSIKDNEYYKFTGWQKWQKVDHAQASIIPEPLPLTEQSVNNPESFTEQSMNDSVNSPASFDEEPLPNIRESNIRESNLIEERANQEDSLNDSLSPQAMELCKYYETLKMGQSISAHMDSLKIMIDMYGYDWCREALQRTVSQKGKFIQSYMEAILKNWQKEGKQDAPVGNGKHENEDEGIKVRKTTFNSYDQRKRTKEEIKKIENSLLGRDEDG